MFRPWTPQQLIDRWRCEVDAATASYPDRWLGAGLGAQHSEYRRLAFGIPDLLFRLGTDERMRSAVWQRLERFARRGPASHVAPYIDAVLASWMGPWGEERWTPSQRSRWACDVNVLARRLAAKLEGTEADQALGVQLRAGMKASQFMRALGETAGSRLALYYGRGRREYFVRRLTAHCQAKLGGPNRKLVAVSAAVALDQAIGERQVCRLAPLTRFSESHIGRVIPPCTADGLQCECTGKGEKT